jgi:hypothetical protein
LVASVSKLREDERNKRRTYETWELGRRGEPVLLAVLLIYGRFMYRMGSNAGYSTRSGIYSTALMNPKMNPHGIFSPFVQGFPHPFSEYVS